MMKDCRQFYINGTWVEPESGRIFEVINPYTEKVCGRISLGNKVDVDRAVKAAKEAFKSYAITSKDVRLELLQRIQKAFNNRVDELADILTQEMGAPCTVARDIHAHLGVAHLDAIIDVYKSYQHQQMRGNTHVVKEPIGVCGLIVPWNFPIGVTLSKLLPALAVGCTVVLKPSEIAPLWAHLLAEVLHEAEVPKGVFNLVDGDGPEVGHAICTHPDVDMVSFTGSTAAGIAVAKAASDTVKRIAQELGGKSANILLPGADFETAVTSGVQGCFLNSGQNCMAPTRMLVPIDKMQRCEEIAEAAAQAMIIGDPSSSKTQLGPVVSESHYQRVQALIKKGIGEGAKLLCGGLGKPQGLDTGFFVRPTIFSRADNKMTIAQEEVFGPVLVIIGYRSEQEAVDIANDSPFGLAAFIQSGDTAAIGRVAASLRVGCIFINNTYPDLTAPFGGFKQSGNGREWGVYGLEEYVEVKSVVGLLQ